MYVQNTLQNGWSVWMEQNGLSAVEQEKENTFA